MILFGRDIAVGLGRDTLEGLGLAVAGTVFFSLGNMASRRNSAAGITPLIGECLGHGLRRFGAAGPDRAHQHALHGAADGRYVAALVYLAAIGSVVGFTTYLSLVARVGSSRAAYATVLFPIVALALSTLFEGYRLALDGRGRPRRGAARQRRDLPAARGRARPR